MSGTIHIGVALFVDLSRSEIWHAFLCMRAIVPCHLSYARSITTHIFFLTVYRRAETGSVVKHARTCISCSGVSWPPLNSSSIHSLQPFDTGPTLHTAEFVMALQALASPFQARYEAQQHSVLETLP